MSAQVVRETLYTYQGEPRRMVCSEFRLEDNKLRLIFQFYAGEHLIGVLDSHQVDVQISLREVKVVQLSHLLEKKQRELVTYDLFAPHGLWQAHIECRPHEVCVKLGEETQKYEEVRSMTIVHHG